MAMTMEELEKKLGEVEGQLIAANTRADELDTQLAVAQLSTEDHAAFDALPGADQTAFGKADVAARETSIAKGREIVAKAAVLPEAVTKKMEEVQKKLDAAEARAAAAETIAKSERDQRRKSELTKQAETEYPNLPGTPEEKGNVLACLEQKLTADEAESVRKLLRAGNVAAGDLTKTIGKSTTAVGGGDTWTVIEKKADAKVAASAAGNKPITKAAAVQAVCDEEPELYTRYLKEQPATSQA